MFIRIKKRKFSAGTKKYAYLVRSKYYKKGSRQKVVKYLGKVNEIKKIRNKKKKSKKKEINIKKTKNAEKFIIELVKRELRNFGFREKETLFFIHSKGFRINLIDQTVSDEKQEITLALNYGILCNFTLKELFDELKSDKDEIKKTKNLGKKLIAAGITVKKQEFVELYNLIRAKSNDKQSQAIPGNPRQ